MAVWGCGPNLGGCESCRGWRHAGAGALDTPRCDLIVFAVTVPVGAPIGVSFSAVIPVVFSGAVVVVAVARAGRGLRNGSSFCSGGVSGGVNGVFSARAEGEEADSCCGGSGEEVPGRGHGRSFRREAAFVTEFTFCNDRSSGIVPSGLDEAFIMVKPVCRRSGCCGTWPSSYRGKAKP